MIAFERFTLENGLRVIHHRNQGSTMATLNLLYDVGAKDESPEQTGFAHLFEHLMFGGSANIPDFDKPLNSVGGENNAFTTNDYTNYYISVPTNNLERAFWLESDRMLKLDFSQKSLDVQKQVVIEEYNQSYLNQPYGDVWLLLRPLIYSVHPYRWPTIGADVKHIEDATLADVEDFFYTHYGPNNAVLTIVADVPTDEVKALAQKWFGPIPRRKIKERNLPVEPRQTEAKFLEVERDVPFDMLTKVYRMGRRSDPDFYTVDLVSDLLSGGDSSRFYQRLVKEQQLFTYADAYLMGDVEPSMFVISGSLSEGVTFQQAEDAIAVEIDKIINNPVPEQELRKVKNKLESSIEFSYLNSLNKAINLSTLELQDDANLINNEISHYESVMREEIMAVARKMLRPENCTTLHYHAKK